MSGDRLRGYSKKVVQHGSETHRLPLRGWLWKRRKEIAERQRHNLASEASEPQQVDHEALGVIAQAQAGEAWTPQHDTESNRQAKIASVRFLEAAKQGHVLESEKTDELEAQLQALSEVHDKRRQERQSVEQKQSDMLRRPTVNVFGKRVNVQPGLYPSRAAILPIMLQHHYRWARNSHDVDIYVVADVSNPGNTETTQASLQGSMIVSPTFFETGGTIGSCLSYISPLHIEKRIFMSHNFCTLHQPCAAAFDRAIADCATKWVQMDTLADWLRSQIANPKNGSRFLALLTQAEKEAQPALREHKWCMTLADFLNHITRLSHERSCLGVGIAS